VHLGFNKFSYLSIYCTKYSHTGILNRRTVLFCLTFLFGHVLNIPNRKTLSLRGNSTPIHTGYAIKLFVTIHSFEYLLVHISQKTLKEAFNYGASRRRDISLSVNQVQVMILNSMSIECQKSIKLLNMHSLLIAL